ncbi:hypothetical protein [Jannaschia rubra]|uniref:hypothetical protein n=1 Tax=Jannaschia rubra TaxID=282197 RepID=UPI000B2CA3A9|nr:hypothetical protein [Jannaschia rubra]
MEDQMFGSIRAKDADGFMGRADASLRVMEAMRSAMETKLAELTAAQGDGPKAADLAALQRDLARAVLQAVAEEGKVADALRIERGGDGIDFDAARASIRRRLDSIREHLGEGGVSCGPDGE